MRSDNNALTTSVDEIADLLQQAKKIAVEYRRITGRPLGITGEIAEFEAVRILGLELSTVRQPGYDAIRQCGERVERLQIKGRCLLDASRRGQRIGSIQLSKEWDGVLLVILDAELNAVAIYEADRHSIAEALTAPGSKSRNERGALGVSKFKSIGKKIWERNEGAVGSGIQRGTVRRR